MASGDPAPLRGRLQAQSLTVTPSGYLTVPVGGTLQCTAVASGFTVAGIKWEVGSLQGGNATTGTITTGLTGGLYTAPAAIPGQNPQTIMAVVTATNGNKYSASGFVYILAPAAVITSVSPNPLPVGTSTVTITGSGFTPNSLIWDSGVQYPTQQTSANTLTASVYTGTGTTSATFTIVSSGSTSNAIVVPVGSGSPATYSLAVVNGTGSGNYQAGAVVNISANAAPAGKQFQSWTGAAVANASSASTSLTMPAASTTVTANYAAIPPATYSLTVVNGTGSGSYAAGTVVTIAANAAPPGQQFQSWTGATVANASSAGTTITMPAANTTVTAGYAAVATYTLTVVNGTGSGSYAAGAVVNISANAAPANQQFQSWTGATVANASSAGTMITMPAANTTVSASYAAIPTYSLTVVNGTGSGTYAAGAVVNISANAAPANQQFQSWTGAKVANASSAGTKLTMPAANTTVTAHYAALVSGLNIGSVSPNPLPTGTVTVTVTGTGFNSNPIIWASGVQYPTLQPASNTLTTSVYIAPGTPSLIFTVHNGGAVSNAITVPVSGAPATTYTLTLINGTINGASSGSYPAGTVVSISANAAPPGESFTGWTGAAVANAGASSTTITMPAASTMVTANFAATATYMLTVINGTNSGSYTAGTVVAIAANTAPTGQVFSSWSGAPVTSPTSPTTTLTMPAANTTVTANYSAPLSGAYTVTYSAVDSTRQNRPYRPQRVFHGPGGHGASEHRLSFQSRPLFHWLEYRGSMARARATACGGLSSPWAIPMRPSTHSGIRRTGLSPCGAERAPPSSSKPIAPSGPGA